MSYSFFTISLTRAVIVILHIKKTFFIFIY